MGASEIARALSISPQAVHRHLLRLRAEGRLSRVGEPPRTIYRLASPRTRDTYLADLKRVVIQVLGEHPAVRLVTLFGSQARGEAREGSDTDLLVWIEARGGFTPQDIWRYWDRHTQGVPWATGASLVVRRLTRKLSIDTLLLDLPEEHLALYDAETHFEALRDAVVRWRVKNGSVRVPSFGGTHFWRYSSNPRAQLDDIDFTLELMNVT